MSFNAICENKILAKIYESTVYKGLIYNLVFLSRINCYEVVNAQAPFGGFKMSGIGREL